MTRKTPVKKRILRDGLMCAPGELPQTIRLSFKENDGITSWKVDSCLSSKELEDYVVREEVHNQIFDKINPDYAKWDDKMKDLYRSNASDNEIDMHISREPPFDTVSPLEVIKFLEDKHIVRRVAKISIPIANINLEY